MTATQPAPTPTRPSPRGRTVAVVAASIVAGLIALGLLAGGLVLVGAHALLRDADGYYTSSAERLETPTYALTAEGLQLGDAGGATGWLVELAADRIRVRARSAEGGPVFVGIALERVVDRWFARIAHDEVTDVRFNPFSYDSVRKDGATAPGRPERQGFWAASAAGSGSQTVDWRVRAGRWSVVVMNADGHAGVRADVRVAVASRLFLPVGIAMLMTALLLLGAAIVGLRPSLRTGAR